MAWCRRSGVAMAALAAAAVLTGAAPALASGPPAARILTTFSYAAGQTPEALAVAPDGTAYVSLSEASEVARVSLSGRTQVIARLPRGRTCPVFNVPISVGIVLLPGGALDVAVCDDDSDTGIWPVQAGHAPREITRLPEDSVPNGVALDPRTGYLYTTDSSLGIVWRSPASGGPAVAWAKSPALLPVSYAGANGCYVEGGAVWVSNTDRGTVIRIPIRGDGSAGPLGTVASGLASAGLDDFTVLPGGRILMAEYVANRIVLIRPGGGTSVILSGLNNPVDVMVSHRLMYVADSAYITGRLPNLLVAAGRSLGGP